MADIITLRARDREYKVQITPDGAIVDGLETAIPAHAYAVADGDRRLVFLNGEVFEFEIARQGRRRSAAHASSLSAPMPATVTRINIAAGDVVKKGDTLVVLEAMKMELPVRAPSDGIVDTVGCKVGELVQPGIALVTLKEA